MGGRAFEDRRRGIRSAPELRRGIRSAPELRPVTPQHGDWGHTQLESARPKKIVTVTNQSNLCLETLKNSANMFDKGFLCVVFSENISPLSTPNDLFSMFL